ncbi:MAG: hypothetical protein HYY35_09750 [Deltaproteobacteria bacterium]|nr:hypothetical protein [Deltaproteobacteria bacterium]
MSRHRFAALVEPLAAEASFVSRPMFGCVACYRQGRLVLVLADRREPWQGLLVPTERRAHASLLEEFPPLRVHPVLGKWLYLAHAVDGFAAGAAQIVERIAAGDGRFGVEPALPRLPRPKTARANAARTGVAGRRAPR